MKNIYLVIPAREYSTRLPRKPLLTIGNRTLLQHVILSAKQAISESQIRDIQLIVASESENILNHARLEQVQTVLTSQDCQNGTERIFEALQNIQAVKESLTPETWVINLQGDSLFLPISLITKFIISVQNSGSEKQILTPMVQLTWDQLDQFRTQKKMPDRAFSGTTVVFDAISKKAHWFSKQILPSIRGESDLRQQPDFLRYSPVYRHVGLYAYRWENLSQYQACPVSVYESLEGLEQLRFLINGTSIHMIDMTEQSLNQNLLFSGIDSPADLEQARSVFKQFEETEKYGS